MCFRKYFVLLAALSFPTFAGEAEYQALLSTYKELYILNEQLQQKELITGPQGDIGEAGEKGEAGVKGLPGENFTSEELDAMYLSLSVSSSELNLIYEDAKVIKLRVDDTEKLIDSLDGFLNNIEAQ